MFAEPMSVTYDTVPKSLARVTDASRGGVGQITGHSVFRTADDEFTVYITEGLMKGNVRRFEVTLERVQQDPDGPFVGTWVKLPNRVSLSFEVNSLKFNTATDVPLLQSAILDLVDGPFRDRLLSGEK